MAKSPWRGTIAVTQTVWVTHNRHPIFYKTKDHATLERGKQNLMHPHFVNYELSLKVVMMCSLYILFGLCCVWKFFMQFEIWNSLNL